MSELEPAPTVHDAEEMADEAPTSESAIGVEMDPKQVAKDESISLDHILTSEEEASAIATMAVLFERCKLPGVPPPLIS